MRDRITAELGSVRYDDFLAYVLGPYTAFDPTEVLPEKRDPDSLPVHGPAEGKFDALELLEHLRAELRREPGLNAFLAIDVGIDLEEMDAATQSIEFARASNATVFVVPAVGRNLGVGIEVGSILEVMSDNDRERVLFVHERGLSSAMLASLPDRWDVSVRSYERRTDLVRRVREFVFSVILRERRGALSRK